jgi:hypothetical protein
VVTKFNITEELQGILDIIKEYPEGAEFNAILEKVQPLQLHERTLQRRLKALVDRRDVTVSGRSRSIRYHIPVAQADDRAVPVSPAGKEITALVRRPLSIRDPVGYKRDLLESYQPNITYYLSATDRTKLTGIGQSPVAAERPAGTYARTILNRLLVDLSWNSSRLEGNTYSLLDTQRLIAFGKAAEGKSLRDAQMILNHKEAIEFLVASAENLGFSRHTILSLHALLANGLLGNQRAIGRLRNIAVAIGKSSFTPLAQPQRIEECFDLILAKAAAITDPFEQSFFAMVHLPYLQPFEDVNKRVSRLAANIPLLARNLSPLSFTEVPEATYIEGMLGIYELNRLELFKDVYMWAYERSANQYAALRHTIGEPDTFRVRHRTIIQETVGRIVTGQMDQATARQAIEGRSADLPPADRPRFVETVESELLALHEGNIAPYRLTPEQFEAWQRVWSRG